MTIRLTSRQISRLSNCLGTAARPLDFESTDQWRQEVLKSVITLFGAKAGHFDVDSDGCRWPALFLGYPPEASSVWNDHWRHHDAVTSMAEPLPETYTRRWRYRRRGLEWSEQYHASAVFNEFYVPYELDVDASGFHVRDAGMKMHLHIDAPGRWSEQKDLRVRHVMRLIRPVLASSVRAMSGYVDGPMPPSRLLEALDCEVAILNPAGRWLHSTAHLERTLSSYESEYVAQWRERVSAVARIALRRPTRSGHCSEFHSQPGALDFAGRRVSLVISHGASALNAPVALLRIQTLDIPTECPAALLRHALTARQWGVTRLIAMGAGNQEIAERLGTSVHTVRRHVEAIFSKFGVSARAAVASAVWRAIQ